MSQLPDALHVGFSKCASTFLQSFFNEHPSVFLVNQSHFFSPFEYRHYDSGKEVYSALFRDAEPEKVKIESDEHIVLPLFHPVLRAAATTLASVKEVSGKIRDIQPNAKIIIVIRNQVDLIASRYSEYILGGGKSDFDLFVKEYLRCSRDGVNYYQNYYSQIIDIFNNDFLPNRVLVLLQEELAHDEAKILRQLCGFLNIGVPQPHRRGLRSRRVGLSDLGIKVVRSFNNAVIERQEQSYTKAVAKIPYPFYKASLRAMRLVDYYLPKSVKGDKNKVLTADIVERIRGEFREDNTRLAELLGKDLASLGY
ncbi:MAG: sulfotransferase [Gammaproteobacteria bacterium]|nr:sulfotransferase [Gammaproteobacteria bacterium]